MLAPGDFTRKLAELPQPSVDLGPWLDLTRTGYWMKLVMCAVDASIKSPVSINATVVDVVESACVPCYECGRLFRSINDVRNQAHRSHG